jgi:protocatechuate 3,4-dioxygenase beta subunit
MIATVVLAIACLGGALMPPTPQPAADAPKPATIRGRVTDATNGKPLAMVRMRLAGTTRGTPERHTRTNADGRFEFRDLPPGRVTISAAKARFVTLQHGQELPAPSGRPIDVTAGALIDRINFALPRAAAITGRIVDDYGEPMAGASVEAMQVKYVDGRRRLASVASAITNDAGEYRIHALQPGRYYVVAAERREGFGVEMDADIGLQRTAYPAATTLAQARAVDVAAGRDTSGIDIALVAGTPARVTGTVIGPDAQPLGGIRLTVQAVGDGPGAGLGGEVTTRPDGKFVLPHMLPGRYELHARGKTDRFVGAIVPLKVAADADIVVPVTAGGRMRGRVVPPEGTTARPSEVALSAAPLGETFVFGTGFGGTVKDDWTFDWDYLLGTRVVRASRMPRGWYLKAVRRGEQDITDEPLAFKADETIDDLELLLANDGASVSGTAVAADGKPCMRCTVILFGDDRSRWTHPSRFIHTAVPDQNNAFTLESLVPGRYLAAAVTDLEPGQAFYPEFLEQLRTSATVVDLTTVRAASLSLKVVKP